MIALATITGSCRFSSRWKRLVSCLQGPAGRARTPAAPRANWILYEKRQERTVAETG